MVSVKTLGNRNLETGSVALFLAVQQMSLPILLLNITTILPWVQSSPTNRGGGPKSTFFRRFRNLTTTFTAYIFGSKHDVDNRASTLATRRGLLHRLKTTRTLVHKRIKIGPAFLLTLRKICILIRCQASQTEIRKRNSTKLCQMVDSKSR